MFWALVRKDLRANRTPLALFGLVLIALALTTTLPRWDLLTWFGAAVTPLFLGVTGAFALFVGPSGRDTDAFLACLPPSRRARLGTTTALALALIVVAVATCAGVTLVGLCTLDARNGAHDGPVARTLARGIVWPGSAVLLWMWAVCTAAVLRTRQLGACQRDCLVWLFVPTFALGWMDSRLGTRLLNLLGPPPLDPAFMAALGAIALVGLTAAVRADLTVAPLDHRKRARGVLRAQLLSATFAIAAVAVVHAVTVRPQFAHTAGVERALLSRDASRLVVQATQRHAGRETEAWLWACEVGRGEWRHLGRGMPDTWWEDGETVVVSPRLERAPWGARTIVNVSTASSRPLKVAEGARQAVARDEELRIVSVDPDTGRTVARYSNHGAPPDKCGRLVCFSEAHPEGQVMPVSPGHGFVAWTPDGSGACLVRYAEPAQRGDPGTPSRQVYGVAEVFCLDLDTHNRTPVFAANDSSFVFYSAHSPDRHRLALAASSEGRRGKRHRVAFVSSDGSVARTEWLPGRVSSLAWHRDGNSLSVVDDVGGPLRFAPEDLADPVSLLTTLRDADDPVSVYLRGQFATGTLQQIHGYKNAAGGPPEALVGAIIGELNRALDSHLYEPGRFEHVRLREATTRLVPSSDMSSDSNVRLNRLLLEDAYPQALRPHPLNPNQERDLFVIVTLRLPSLKHTFSLPFRARCSLFPTTLEERREAGQKVRGSDLSLGGAGIWRAAASPDGTALAFVCTQSGRHVAPVQPRWLIFQRPRGPEVWHHAISLFTVSHRHARPRELATLANADFHMKEPPWMPKSPWRMPQLQALGWHKQRGIICVLSDGRVLAVDPEDGTVTDLLRTGEVAS